MQTHDSKFADPLEISPASKLLLERIERGYLESVVSAISYPRHYGEEPNANRNAARWIAAEFESFGYEVSFQGPYDNIVASPKPGADERTIIGAHYDSVPGTPGADDNASAVAVMLACAKALAGDGMGSSVVLVSFNREEDDLMGSRAFVRQLPFKVSAAHILEMVGYFSTEAGSQRLPPGLPVEAPDIGDFLTLVANDSSTFLLGPILRLARTYLTDFHVLGLDVPQGAERHFPVLLRSDHAPFWERGFPAIMWTDTSEYRNPNYHTSSDTPETLDYDSMRRVAQLLLLSVTQETNIPSSRDPRVSG